MIAEVEHSITALDRSIEVAMELAGIRDTSHHAYPMVARAMEATRQNLIATRPELEEHLQVLLEHSPRLRPYLTKSSSRSELAQPTTLLRAHEAVANCKPRLASVR
jgi:hypothetical protein